MNLAIRIYNLNVNSNKEIYLYYKDSFNRWDFSPKGDN